ncbi:hypothetical protein HDU98_011580 [Podochytrium sp. JEL0797]|nr:hypothetical protein HDU98_011580 [Podochytrium sp. JEL0797]
MIMEYSYDASPLSHDLKLPLQRGAFLFATRSLLGPNHAIRATQEATTFAKYMYLVDTQGIMEVHLLDPDSIWIVAIPASLAENENSINEVVLPLMMHDSFTDVGALLCDEFGAPITFVEATEPIKSPCSILEYYKQIGITAGQTPPTQCICLRFFVQRDGRNAWISTRNPTEDLSSQPEVQVSALVECTNKLGALRLEHARSFLAPTSSKFIEEASQVAEQIGTGLELFNKITSYSGNAADALRKFNFDFGSLLSGLDYIANIGSIVPFVSSACSIISALVEFAKKLEQNEKNVLYLKQHGSLLQQAIDTRVKAYFSSDSDWIIDDETCLKTYCNVLSDSAKVLIAVVETVCKFDKKSLVSKFLKNDVVDIFDSQQQLDYSFKSILALDPIHIAFNLNTIVMLFHSPEALDFWKANRFRYSADGNLLFEGLFKSFKPSESEETKETFQFRLLQVLKTRPDGYVTAQDFGEWYSSTKIQALLNESRQALSPKAARVPSFSTLSSLLAPSSFEAEIQGFLNDRVPGSRDWLLKHLEQSKSQGFILDAGAGFGKSMISAAAVSRWRSLHYFFKADDKLLRTADNFLRSLLSQLHSHLLECDAGRAGTLEREILGAGALEFDTLERVLRETASSGVGSIEWLIIDALDECPSKDQVRVFQLLVNFTAACGSVKILITTRPEAISTSFKRMVSFKASGLCERPLLDARQDSGFQEAARPFEALSSLETSHENENDIRVYLESTLREVSDRGVNILLSKAQGCFLWAKLAVSIIRDLNEEAHVTYIAHTALQTSLPHLYFTSFGNCLKMPSYFQEGIYRIMSLSFAMMNPPTTAELEYAWVRSWLHKLQDKTLRNSSVAEKGTTDWRELEGSKIFAQCFLYALSRLMLRANGNGLVMIGHKSLRDSVGRNQLSRFVDLESGHMDMSIVCLELLESLSRGSVGRAASDRFTKRAHDPDTAKFHLTQYACRFWFVHAEQLSQARGEIIWSRILSVFDSEKAIHWVAMLADQNRLDSARSGLRFLSARLPGISNGLLEVVDRFSDILLESPAEIYTSVAVFGLSSNSASKLFNRVNDVLPSGYRPRVLLGAELFWMSESSAVTSPIKKPVVAFNSNNVGNAVVVNRHLDGPGCAIESWDVDRRRLVAQREAPWTNMTQFVTGIVIVDDESLELVAAIFKGVSEVCVWIDGAVEPLRVGLKSVPLDLRILCVGSTSILVFLLETMVAVAEVKIGEEGVRIDVQLLALPVPELQKGYRMQCVFIGGKLWVGVVAGSQSRAVLRLLSSSHTPRGFAELSDAAIEWADFDLQSLQDFILCNDDGAACIGIVTASGAAFWDSKTRDVKTCSLRQFEVEATPAETLLNLHRIQLQAKKMVLACDNSLVVIDFNIPFPPATPLKHSPDWKQQHVSVFTHKGVEYALHATGTEESFFDTVTLCNLRDSTTSEILNCQFSSIDVQGTQMILCDTQDSRVTRHNLESWIFKLNSGLASVGWTKIGDASETVRRREPNNVLSMCVSNDGRLFLLRDMQAVVEVWDLNYSYAGVQCVHQLPNAAAFVDDRKDRCDMQISEDGSRMVISSNLCGTLSWWEDMNTESPPRASRSPRLMHQVNENIAIGWNDCVFDKRADHLVFASYNNRQKPRRHICYANIASELGKESVESTPSSGLQIIVPSVLVGPVDDSEEEFYGFEIFEEPEESPTSRASSDLNGSEYCSIGCIVDADGTSWFIGSNCCKLSLWNLNASKDPIDTIHVQHSRSGRVFSRQADKEYIDNDYEYYKFYINNVHAASQQSGAALAIGFSQGLIVLLQIQDGKFVLSSLSSTTFDDMRDRQIHELQICTDEKVVIVHTRDKKDAERSDVFVFGLMERVGDGGGLQLVLSPQLSMTNEFILQYSLVGEGGTDVPFGIVLFAKSGRLFRCRIGETVTALVKEISLPGSFVEDKFQSMLTYGDKVVLRLERKLLVIDLGSQKVIEL